MPVVGTRSTLVAAAQELDADAVIFAVPSASGHAIGQAQEAAQRAGLDFLVLPRVSELIEGRVTASDIRPVEIGDVLGRHQVSTSISDIAGYLTGAASSSPVPAARSAPSWPARSTVRSGVAGAARP